MGNYPWKEKNITEKITITVLLYITIGYSYSTIGHIWITIISWIMATSHITTEVSCLFSRRAGRAFHLSNGDRGWICRTTRAPVSAKNLIEVQRNVSLPHGFMDFYNVRPPR